MLALGTALGGSAAAQAPGGLKTPDIALEPVAWTDLEGWSVDDHAAAFKTWLASCRSVVKLSAAARDARPILNSLEPICRRALAGGPRDNTLARVFFEENFRPVRIAKLGETTGLLTGYYEPVVDGSRFPTGYYNVPIYRRPRDLVAVKGVPADGVFPNKGEIARRTRDGQLVPYYDRGEIEDGVLDGKQLEICYLRDPIAAFTIHIQGSARVRLEDGLMVRLNYDGHNGHPYTPVGRVLIERSLVPRDEMSMDRIRSWMLAYPREARDLRRQNRSFIFFRAIGLGDEGQALGAQGIELTPWRSIAVDKALHAYGTPFFIEADLPIASAAPTTPFRRLMIAQDTGSAIVGPARADLFFGAGDEAGRIAGRMRHQGRFTMLVPRDLDPAVTAGGTPLPRPKVMEPKPEAPVNPAR